MIRSTFISTIAVAAMMAVPAFANNSAAKQTSTTGDAAIVSGSTGATVNSNATANPGSITTENIATANTDLPPCSTLEAGKSGRMQPNAGKLADKSTGKAKQHSKSAVHEDCLSDTTSSTISSTTPSTTSNLPSTASTTGTTSSMNGSTASSSMSNGTSSGTMGSTSPSGNMAKQGASTTSNTTR